mgnify:CR=1 FL=1
MDFTLERYKELMGTLLRQGFSYYGVYGYILQRLRRIEEHRFHRGEKEVGGDRVIILRQDIDRLPENSLVIAKIQKELGIKSTFYFRSVARSFEPEVIEKIAGMGHEVGYHYEDVSLTANSSKSLVSSSKFREKDLIDESIGTFDRNLERLMEYAGVKTICMHGSPMSRWDSRLLWKYYDYKDFGIECEPYFDMDMEEMLYLTDTGRKWNGSAVSVRDKAQGPEHRAQSTLLHSSILEGQGRASDFATDLAEASSGKQGLEDQFNAWVRKPVSGSLMNMTGKSLEFQRGYNFRTTEDIVRAAERDRLPDRMMMNFHPHRWNNFGMQWWKELVGQNIKNSVKYFIIRIRPGN